MIKFKMVDGKNPEDVRYAVRSKRKLIGYLNLVKHQTAIRVSSRLEAKRGTHHQGRLAVRVA